MSDLSKRIANLTPEQRVLLEARLRKDSPRANPQVSEPIAVIGMGCGFPGGANDPAAYWDMLRQGVDAITTIPLNRWDGEALFDPDPAATGKAATRWGAFLDQVDQFDAAFF